MRSPQVFCGEVELANGILKSLAMVKQAPTADVAPVVHGEWLIENSEPHYSQDGFNVIIKCSVCGNKHWLGLTDYRNEFTKENLRDEHYTKYRFCGSCGADMRKAVE